MSMASRAIFSNFFEDQTTHDTFRDCLCTFSDNLFQNSCICIATKCFSLWVAHCTSLGLYDLEVIQWGSIYSNTVYNSLHFKHRYFFLSILILSSALTPLVQTTSLLSFSTPNSILIFSGIFFIFSEIRKDTSQRLKWRPQSSNREWRSQSWHLHH